jgi:hypothetical protein
MSTIYSFGNSLVSAPSGPLVGRDYDRWNPLRLPAFSILVECMAGNVPHNTVGTATNVGDDTWLIQYSRPDWYNMFGNDLSIVKVLGANTAGVTGMARMFDGCTNLERIENSFDMSSVTSTRDMFSLCTNFQSAGDLNTSSAVWMDGMFYGCTALQNIGSIDTSSATDIANLLYRCQSLLEMPSLNTENVTDMLGAFYRCTGITSIKYMDTHNVVNMSHAFGGCISISTLPLMDFSNVENLDGFVTGCTNLTTLPAFNTSKVKNWDNAFAYCSALDFDNFPQLDTSRAESMSATFRQTNIPSIPSWLDTSGVTSFSQMFYGCEALGRITAMDMENAQNVDEMFCDCYHVSTGALQLYQYLSGISGISSHNRCFHYCGIHSSSGEAELDQIPDDWK